MDFISEEERVAHTENRIDIYNQIQMIIAGTDQVAAVSAICDALSVAVVQICAADREKSHALLDTLFPSIKRCADNNLDLVAEQIKLAAAARIAGAS